jgi:hypothetical protein
MSEDTKLPVHVIYLTPEEREEFARSTSKQIKQQRKKMDAKGEELYYQDKLPPLSLYLLGWQCRVPSEEYGRALQELGLPIPPLTPIFIRA